MKLTRQSFDSVWDAIEDTPAEAENMRLRSELLMALQAHIRKRNWEQGEAAAALGITQAQLSDLMRGRIDLFGLDNLVNILAAAGLHVDVHVNTDDST